MAPRKKKEIKPVVQNTGVSAGISNVIENIKAEARKSFSSELIRTLNEKPIQGIEGISFGAPSLNYICTGSPFVGAANGRIYEIFGPESSGKTTLALHLIAEAQRNGESAVFIDAEHALDVVYSQSLGVDIDHLLFCQPDYGEQALEVALEFVKQGVMIIVIDSVAALTPLAEIEGTMEKDHMGLQARMMGKFMRKISGLLAKSKSVLVMINQNREKIGVMFGDPTTQPGGKALKFYSSVRLACSLSTTQKNAIKGAVQTLASEKEVQRLGSNMIVKVVKNKIAPPFRECEIPLYYGKGLDQVYDWYEFAAKIGVIEKGKGGYTVDGKRILYEQLTSHVYDVQELVRRKIG